jgi:hypothetical protein
MTLTAHWQNWTWGDLEDLAIRFFDRLAVTIQGIVSFSFIKSPVRLRRTKPAPRRPDDLYQMGLIDGGVYSSLIQPSFYGAQNRRIAAFDPRPGSEVNIHLDSENWMDAVQVVTDVPEEPSPFLPNGRGDSDQS